MSTDSGATWSPRESARNWVSVTSSADGRVLVAVEFGGRIYISRDLRELGSARDTRMWYGVAASVDGNSLVAVVAGGRIYTSGLCTGNVADRITFDCVPNDTIVNTLYVASAGVTLTNPLGGNIVARNAGGLSPSLPNAVSVHPSGATSYPYFDALAGAVEAHFATPQRSVSIDARPAAPGEFLGVLLNRPFLEATTRVTRFWGGCSTAVRCPPDPSR